MSVHGGLSYLFDQPKLNEKQGRWLASFSESGFEIQHIKGKKNKVEDALSRRKLVAHVAAINTCEDHIKETLKRKCSSMRINIK